MKTKSSYLFLLLFTLITIQGCSRKSGCPSNEVKAPDLENYKPSKKKNRGLF